MTLSDLNVLLDLNPEADLFSPSLSPFLEYDAFRWWQTITDFEEFNTKYSMANHIIHPVFRILHRILGFAVFSKQDLSKLSHEELFTLWVATREELKGRLNMGYWFVLCCEAIKSGHKIGEMTLGGMITRIAKKLKYERFFPSCTQVGADKYLFINIQQMRRSGFLQGTSDANNFHAWMVDREHHCILPYPSRTSFERNARNVWKIQRDNGVLPTAQGGIRNIEVDQQQQQQQQ